MSDPVSLRNIPPELLEKARVLGRHTGLSVNAVLRLALASGLLVELTKVTPDAAGTYGGMEAAVLARALRRHLASAIDFLIEQGEHPYQGALPNVSGRAVPAPPHEARSSLHREQGAFDHTIAEDLETLGLDRSLSEMSG